MNGTTVIPGATIPDLPARGRLALQHHGGKNKQGEWTGPPSLVQFKNIYIKELSPRRCRRELIPLGRREGPADHRADTTRRVVLHAVPRYPNLARLPVDAAPTAFKNDLRDKYDVIIMYDFSRDLDEAGRKNLRDFVESGKGIVVLHHALLNYQTWTWWYQEVVGGSYRLQRRGRRPVVDREGRPGDAR